MPDSEGLGFLKDGIVDYWSFTEATDLQYICLFIVFQCRDKYGRTGSSGVTCSIHVDEFLIFQLTSLQPLFFLSALSVTVTLYSAFCLFIFSFALIQS